MNLISIYELKSIRDDQDLFLLDVREHSEVASVPMENMPYVHIPMGEIPSSLERIDNNCRIVVFCRSGKRSENICDFLISKGYSDVYNLTGGILAWYK